MDFIESSDWFAWYVYFNHVFSSNPWTRNVFSFHLQVSPVNLFLKVCFMLLCFYERPTTLVPVFANWKKSKEGAHFYKKCKKQKECSSICFVRSSYRGSMNPTPWKECCQAPFLRTTTSVSSHHIFELSLWKSVLYLNLSFCLCKPEVITSTF